MQPMITKVPPEDERPRQLDVTFHGDYHTYAELSEEHRRNGGRIRDGRAGRGLSLRDGAQLLGISIVELAECERGVREIDYEEVLRRLDAHGPVKPVDTRKIGALGALDLLVDPAFREKVAIGLGLPVETLFPPVEAVEAYRKAFEAVQDDWVDGPLLKPPDDPKP